MRLDDSLIAASEPEGREPVITAERIETVGCEEYLATCSPCREPVITAERIETMRTRFTSSVGTPCREPVITAERIETGAES